MKHLVALLLTAFLMTSCKTDDWAFNDPGSVKDGVYSNESLGFSFKVPEHWTVLNDSEVADLYLALIGKPTYTEPLLTCCRKNGNNSSVLVCYLQEHTSAERSLCYILTSSNPTIGVGMHSLTLHGRKFNHLQLIETKAKKTYVVDLFSTDFKDNTLLILLSQDPAMSTDAEKFITRYYQPRRPDRDE